MTNTQHTGPSVLDPTDPRAYFGRAMATATAVVAGVRPERHHDPTPCTEYDVTRLFEHLVGVLDRVAAMGRGEDPMSAGAPPAIGDDWNTTWAAAVTAVEAAWADGAALGSTITLPWMTGSGAEVLRAYLSELTVHTWDLAQGSGQKPRWDDEIVAIAYEGSRAGLPGEGRAALFAEVRKQMPPEFRDGPDPFAEVVPTPDDAPLIDKLVAWNGRKP
jgi:uncharacterized protein (TIGR03086 family)